MKHAPFCIRCTQCARTTSKAYASKHEGLCKGCADPDHYQPKQASREEQNARYIDSGYAAWDDR